MSNSFQDLFGDDLTEKERLIAESTGIYDLLDTFDDQFQTNFARYLDGNITKVEIAGLLFDCLVGMREVRMRGNGSPTYNWGLHYGTNHPLIRAEAGMINSVNRFFEVIEAQKLLTHPVLTLHQSHLWIWIG